MNMLLKNASLRITIDGNCLILNGKDIYIDIECHDQYISESDNITISPNDYYIDYYEGIDTFDDEDIIEEVTVFSTDEISRIYNNNLDDCKHDDLELSKNIYINVANNILKNNYYCIDKYITDPVDSKNKFIEAWPDGACINNHSVDMEARMSGIGIYFSHTIGNIFEPIKDHYKTNTRSEMISIIRTIEIINDKFSEPYSAKIYSDSKVTILGLTKYKYNTKNKCCDLWIKLQQLINNSIHSFEFEFIPRSSHRGNIIADILSKLAAYM